MLSWGLNWGFAYDLPTNASYFKEKDERERRSVHETKPMIKRRYRRDLYSNMEVIMNQWVCVGFVINVHYDFLAWTVTHNVTLTRTSTCVVRNTERLAQEDKENNKAAYETVRWLWYDKRRHLISPAYFWDLSLALILPPFTHNFIFYLGWDMTDVNVSSVPFASHRRFSANEESILSLSSLELFSPFPNPKCCHSSIPSWWFTIKLIVVANEKQQNVTYFTRNVNSR